jgi:amidase
MTLQPWEVEANKCKEILASSIPKQWLVPESKLPPATQLNVINFPRESGMLTDKELAITETTATGLVEKMGKGELSAEEVVVAFLKKSVLGQQLVSGGFGRSLRWEVLRRELTTGHFFIAQLCYGIHG